MGTGTPAVRCRRRDHDHRPGAAWSDSAVRLMVTYRGRAGSVASGRVGMDGGTVRPPCADGAEDRRLDQRPAPQEVEVAVGGVLGEAEVERGVGVAGAAQQLLLLHARRLRQPDAGSCRRRPCSRSGAGSRRPPPAPARARRPRDGAAARSSAGRPRASGCRRRTPPPRHRSRWRPGRGRRRCRSHQRNGERPSRSISVSSNCSSSRLSRDRRGQTWPQKGQLAVPSGTSRLALGAGLARARHPVSRPRPRAGSPARSSRGAGRHRRSRARCSRS